MDNKFFKTTDSQFGARLLAPVLKTGRAAALAKVWCRVQDADKSEYYEYRRRRANICCPLVCRMFPK
jgi:hypothetical protein